MNYSEILDAYVREVNEALEAEMAGDAGKVSDAMRYSLLSGGKRVRGAFALAVTDILGGNHAYALKAACAIEMIHCYSLIHDDLPAMDNDDFRRGRPSCHKQFDEATAILAGDALLTKAFEVLGEIDDPAAAMSLVRLYSAGAGNKGMVYGQELDIYGTGKELDAAELDKINAYKTGKLITASILAGACCSSADEDTVSALTAYSKDVGLVFQIVDDVLDQISTFEELGKTIGNDKDNSKETYASLFGVEKAMKISADLTQHAVESVSKIPGNGYLCWYANKLLERRK